MPGMYFGPQSRVLLKGLSVGVGSQCIMNAPLMMTVKKMLGQKKKVYKSWDLVHKEDVYNTGERGEGKPLLFLA